MLLIIVLINAVVHLSAADQGMGVCQRQFCMCTPSYHPSWKNVTCSLDDSQRLDIIAGTIPESATEMAYGGGYAIKFGVNSLSKLEDPRHLQISNTRFLIFSRRCAYEMEAVNLYLEIENVTHVEIETKAFEKSKGPLTVMISDCDEVRIQRDAFSWVISLVIRNVSKLYLESGAFMVDSNSAVIKDYGPGMTIEISNTEIPELPSQVFGSSAAEIHLDNVYVQIVKTNAFSAMNYNKVIATSSSFEVIEQEAFSQKSLINTLEFVNCDISEMQQRAMLSATNSLVIRNTSFSFIQTGSINTTVAYVLIEYCTFSKVYARGFVLNAWNRIKMKNNTFLKMEPHAFVSSAGSVHSFSFTNNIIDKCDNGTFSLIGQAYEGAPYDIEYRNNYYNKQCSCSVGSWLTNTLGIPEKAFEQFAENSYCTIVEIIARCFNAPDKNLRINKFLNEVCGDQENITCEPFKTKTENGSAPNFENPFFPDTDDEDSSGLNDRNKKVVGIVIVTILGCVLIALFISLIKWMKRNGYCNKIKNAVIVSQTACTAGCSRLFSSNNRTNSSRSISHLSVVEYTEQQRLNEPRMLGTNQTFTPMTNVPDNDANMATENKTTQTLPEELTKELLDSLRQKLDDPENYAEAREMIEHLYELIKVDENPTVETGLITPEENIYDLPFQNTTNRVGKNKKPMVSVGTKVPSLERLLPLSPYNRPTALSHEYFEPKDLTVHLYSEIMNNEKMGKMVAMPDLVGATPMPRGPYLQSVMNKFDPKTQPNAVEKNSEHVANIHSIKTTPMKPTKKMLNRPLPDKPISLDTGEGTSKVFR